MWRGNLATRRWRGKPAATMRGRLLFEDPIRHVIQRGARTLPHRWFVFPAACSDEVREIPGCPPLPSDKTPHDGHVPCGASRAEYDRRPDRLEGARDVTSLKDRLHGIVVVFDGLRYDLWCMLREIMKTEGWRLTEESYVVPSPTTTNNFRSVIGMGDEQKGFIGNKSYVLFKWVERDAGRRELRKILKGSEDIKFLHCNFIDTKMHNSTLDLYPLYLAIKAEFQAGILPILRDLRSFFILSDHGFTDTKRLKERYSHGGESVWETVLPFVEAKLG